MSSSSILLDFQLNNINILSIIYEFEIVCNTQILTEFIMAELTKRKLSDLKIKRMTYNHPIFNKPIDLTEESTFISDETITIQLEKV